MLDGSIGLAFGHMKTFSEKLEVMNQLFHVGLHRLAVRWRHLVVAGDDRPRIDAQPVDTLLDDAVGLAHFGDANQITVIAVARLAHGNVEIHVLIDFVRLLLAQIPCESGTPEHGPGKSEVERPLWRDHADADGALFPDAVVGQQRFVFIDQFGELNHEVVNEIKQ